MSYRPATYEEGANGHYITNCPTNLDKPTCDACFGGPHYDYGTTHPLFPNLVGAAPIVITSISEFE